MGHNFYQPLGYADRLTVMTQLKPVVQEFFHSQEYCLADLARELELPSAVAIDLDLMIRLEQLLSRLRIHFFRKTGALAAIDLEQYEGAITFLEEHDWAGEALSRPEDLTEKFKISSEEAKQMKSRLDLEKLFHQLETNICTFIDQHLYYQPNGVIA